MKVKFIAVVAFMGCAQLVLGQVTDGEATLRKQSSDTTEGWRKGGVISVNATQTSLSHWASGGQNSIAFNAALNLFANYRAGKNTWDNTLDLGYGMSRQDKDGDFIKNDDRIDFTSKYGYEAYKSFYYAALVSFKSQMDNGYNYVNDTTKEKISAFLAPAYIMGAIGLDYKPNNYFSAFLAPVTMKYTVVNDQDLADAGAFGVDAAEYEMVEIKDSSGTVVSTSPGAIIKHGKKARGEFGGYLRLVYSKSDFETEWLKNFSITSKADFFSNYLHNPQNIDVSWETQIAMKVNKYISFTVQTHLIYDDDIKVPVEENGETRMVGSKVQFKEIAGVGIMCKF